VQARTDERSNTFKDTEHDYEPARHLRENALYFVSWRILYTAQSFHKRRILKGLMIQLWQPSLNKKIHCDMAKLKVTSQYFVTLSPFI